MKNILYIFCLFNLLLTVFAFGWCYVLETNIKILEEQMCSTQKTNCEYNIKQDKEIRLIKQDVKLIVMEK